MYCFKCGSENNEASIFCSKCGTELRQQSEKDSDVSGINSVVKDIKNANRHIHSANILNITAMCLTIVFAVVSLLFYLIVFVANATESEPLDTEMMISFVCFVLICFVLSLILFFVGRKVYKITDASKMLRIAKKYRIFAIVIACFAWLAGFYILILTCGSGFFLLVASILQIIAGIRFVAGAKLYAGE